MQWDDLPHTSGGFGGSGGTVIPTIDGSVPVVNPDGTPIGNSGSATVTNYDLIVDDTTTDNVTYLGKAAIGSESGESVWQIQKIDETNGIVIKWANGNDNFVNIWDARTSLTYT